MKHDGETDPVAVLAVPTASLPLAHGCGVVPEAGGPVIASEVERRRWSVRNLVPEVEPLALHAVDPTTGPRSRDDRMLSCEALHLTGRRGGRHQTPRPR